MSIEINEIRLTELTEAVALVKSLENDLDLFCVIPSLSLVAREGARVLGVVLCMEGPDGNHRLMLGLATGDVALERSLFDKALHKLGHRGISKCQIYGPSEKTDFWSAASWDPQAIVDHTDQLDETCSGDQATEDAA